MTLEGTTTHAAAGLDNAAAGSLSHDALVRYASKWRGAIHRHAGSVVLAKPLAKLQRARLKLTLLANLYAEHGLEDLWMVPALLMWESALQPVHLEKLTELASGPATRLRTHLRQVTATLSPVIVRSDIDSAMASLHARHG